MCVTAVRTYAGSVSAPSSARAFGNSAVMAALPPPGWSLADDLSIVVSELVTAAVDAGASSIAVTVTLHYDHLEVLVSHDEAALVPARDVPEDAVGTRRAVLGALTTELTTTMRADGRTYTRAHMSCDPRHTADMSCRLRPGTG